MYFAICQFFIIIVSMSDVKKAGAKSEEEFMIFKRWKKFCEEWIILQMKIFSLREVLKREKL